VKILDVTPWGVMTSLLVLTPVIERIFGVIWSTDFGGIKFRSDRPDRENEMNPLRSVTGCNAHSGEMGW
jgi:hypothetical protein